MKPRSGVCFAGVDKLVHLIGLGETPPLLGSGGTDRFHRAIQTGEGFPDGKLSHLVYAAWLILPCAYDTEMRALFGSKRTK